MNKSEKIDEKKTYSEKVFPHFSFYSIHMSKRALPKEF